MGSLRVQAAANAMEATSRRAVDVLVRVMETPGESGALTDGANLRVGCMFLSEPVCVT
jgi:hypothetical protein